MKNNIIIWTMLLVAVTVTAQEKEKIGETMEQQLESMAALNDAEPEDDTNLQQLNYYKKHPLHINTASAGELAELNILSGLQIQQFLAYRNLLGKLINRYELQAIPSWDIATIKKILPFIEISDDKTLVEKLKDRWAGGDKILLMRYARVLEKSKGYDEPATPGANHYLGSRDKLLLRYKYNYKNILQWGILADKDAGEQFFKGSQKQGFDFYSFHFFTRKLGIIQSLALGDFTINFGQGLIQWQSLAFKKNADALGVKRQSAALRPYNAAGEYNFQRGAGITLQKSNWETTLFASFRKISANINPDSVLNDGVFSSFQTGGYHRTQGENADRNSLQQIATGANIKYQGGKWHAGVNAVNYHFSKPVQKTDQPYNLFALQGSSFTNMSIDYSYTWRNIHLFGEAAADRTFNKAFLNGAFISLGATVDASLVYRKIYRAYQSVNANAFTENTFPVNENGFYAGLSIRPAAAWRLDAYADIFEFPWLKYRVDAPSTGKDFFVQLGYAPNKQLYVYARYKNETNVINRSMDSMATSIASAVPEKNLRLQTSIVINRQLTLRNRVEVVWYDDKGVDAGEGFLGYAEAYYKPAFNNWAGNLRLQYFETSGYNERIYTYEADLPNSFSIPFYYDKGIRYYFNVNYDASGMFKNKRGKPRINIGLKWAQTIYSGKTAIGSGLDVIGGNHHSEIKCQLILMP